MGMTTTIIGAEAVLDIDIRNGTGESPVWNVHEKCWMWIDIPTGSIYRLDPASGQINQWQVGEPLGCMVLQADGSLLCCCVNDIFSVELLRNKEGLIQKQVASVQHSHPGMRFNDGRCDRQGRLWVSSMVMDISLGQRAGCWYRYTQANGLLPMDEGYIIPNGSAFSPDGKTFYASDTHRDVRTVWAWDYDIDGGKAYNKRIFVDMRNMIGRPDGATVDTDGCYWICCLDEGCIKRFTPTGKLDHIFKVPMHKPTMCAFGGEDQQTLFVTSLSRGQDDLATDPYGGRVLMFRPGQQGIVEPRAS